MRKLRYYFNFAVAYTARFRGLILLSVVAGIVIFLLINLIIPRFIANKTLRIGLTGRYTVDNLPSQIVDNISDGLTSINNEGLVEPNLASAWETPDKGKTWVFYIDSNRTWQDGNKVKSTDINYQFSDVDVQKPDDSTIIFKLKEPFSPFPAVVSTPVFKSGLLGTGAWKVINVSLTGSYIQSITIEKEGEGKSIYKFYPSEERTKLAYKIGYVDVISDIIDPQPLDVWKPARVTKNINKNQVVTLFYNNEDELFKDNKELRQALDYAIDKDRFDSLRAVGPIQPDSWVFNPQVKPYNFNQDRAKELIGEKENTKKLEIKLITSPVLLDVAESITKDWEAVGVKTIIQISSVIPSDYQAYLAILDLPKDPDQYSLWHSTQKDTNNISNFTNPRLDKLLEEGRTELDFEARRNIYLDFQKYLAEEVPAAFLYHPVTYTITRI